MAKANWNHSTIFPNYIDDNVQFTDIKVNEIVESHDLPCPEQRDLSVFSLSVLESFAISLELKT